MTEQSFNSQINPATQPLDSNKKDPTSQPPLENPKLYCNELIGAIHSNAELVKLLLGKSYYYSKNVVISSESQGHSIKIGTCERNPITSFNKVG